MMSGCQFAFGPVLWSGRFSRITKTEQLGLVRDALWYSVAEPVSGEEWTPKWTPNGMRVKVHIPQARFGVHFGVHFSTKPGRFGGFPRLWRLRRFPLNGWGSAK
jgi:hypothetical protein